MTLKEFLSPNVTSILQPMNQRVLQNVKLKYRNLHLNLSRREGRFYLGEVEENVIHWVTETWDTDMVFGLSKISDSQGSTVIEFSSMDNQKVDSYNDFYLQFKLRISLRGDTQEMHLQFSTHNNFCHCLLKCSLEMKLSN